jgi:shikimate dehydrogenase
MASTAAITILSRNKQRAQSLLDKCQSESHPRHSENREAIAQNLTSDPADRQLDSEQFAPQILRMTACSESADTKLSAASYADMPDIIPAADVIINATTLGMHKDDPALIPAMLLSPNQLLYDVVYGHGITATAQAAHQASARYADGLPLLKEQALQTIHLWTKKA